jgi:DnaK suppressor protein
MDEFQRDRYAAALRAKRAELLVGLYNREELSVEAEPDIFDEIQRTLDRALVIQTLDRNTLLLRDVVAALDRVRDGSYSLCLRCDEEISTKRLAALPWARFCLTCQEKADIEQREQREESSFFLPHNGHSDHHTRVSVYR